MALPVGSDGLGPFLIPGCAASYSLPVQDVKEEEFEPEDVVEEETEPEKPVQAPALQIRH